MSDFIGLDGAAVLSEQLALYRTLDARKFARDSNALVMNDAAWRNQFNDLAAIMHKGGR